MPNLAGATNADAVFFGLKLYEVLTLIGIIIGPIMAVLITLYVEWARARRAEKLQVFRLLLATFRIASDVNWSVAMNMILIVFNRNKRVMNARREYIVMANERPLPEHQAAHDDRMIAKQIALVYEVARALLFSISEGELRAESYISQGMIDRDNTLLDSQRALRDIAKTLQRQAELNEKLLGAEHVFKSN